MKKEKVLQRKAGVAELREKIVQVRNDIEQANKNEKEFQQTLVKLNQSNTDSVGFVEFIELLKKLDEKKNQRDEIKSKLLWYGNCDSLDLVARFDALSQDTKAKYKDSQDQTYYHHENSTKITENLKKLQKQQADLAFLTKVALRPLCSSRLIARRRKTVWPR